MLLAGYEKLAPDDEAAREMWSFYGEFWGKPLPEEHVNLKDVTGEAAGDGLIDI